MSRRPAGGSVRFDGIDLHANLRTFRGMIGYVPQDDIIHADLPLRQTLRYAARLRLPSSTTAAEIEDTVRTAIDAVGLTEQAEVRVGSLSGGQRKRASIAVELLTEPRRLLPRRADVRASTRPPAPSSWPTCASSPTVRDGRVHHALGRRPRTCDRVVFMARGGRVGFVGTIDEALREFGVASLPELYLRLADGGHR